MSKHDVLADRFLAAITAGDLDTLREIYAHDARIWHNGPQPGGGAEQGVADNLRVLRWLARTLTDLRYTEIRRDDLPAGFVQRHVLRATLPDGSPFEVAACLFVEVDADNRITRIEEYLDTKANDPLLALTRA